MATQTVIGIVNEKGGTGKTSTAVNLSAALGELGRKILLVDLDGQAASSRWLGVEEDSRLADALRLGGGLEPIADVLPGVSLAPASGKLDSVSHELRPTQGGQLRKVLAEVEGFDFVLIDCPPSLSNRLIGNALLASTHVIVPVETSILALDGLRILLTTLEDVREGFERDLILGGVLACRYDPRTRLSRLVLDELRRALPGKVFQTVIRENVRMRECPASGQSILSFAPNCHAAEDYRALAKEMLEHPAAWMESVSGATQTDGQNASEGSDSGLENLRDNAAAAVREASKSASWRTSTDEQETRSQGEGEVQPAESEPAVAAEIETAQSSDQVEPDSQASEVTVAFGPGADADRSGTSESQGAEAWGDSLTQVDPPLETEGADGKVLLPDSPQDASQMQCPVTQPTSEAPEVFSERVDHADEPDNAPQTQAPEVSVAFGGDADADPVRTCESQSVEAWVDSLTQAEQRLEAKGTDEEALLHDSPQEASGTQCPVGQTTPETPAPEATPDEPFGEEPQNENLPGQQAVEVFNQQTDHADEPQKPDDPGDRDDLANLRAYMQRLASEGKLPPATEGSDSAKGGKPSSRRRFLKKTPA